jgi:hypothetical protein
VTLAPAERVELWMNFSDLRVGDRIRLRSLPFDVGMGMMGCAALPNGSDFNVLTVQVDRKVSTRSRRARDADAHLAQSVTGRCKPKLTSDFRTVDGAGKGHAQRPLLRQNG